MPVDTRLAAYNAALPRWTRCRDCREGSDAVKAKRTEYLPLLEGHAHADDPAYTRYIARAQFYNAVDRTVESLAGMVFRKDLVVTAPDATKPLRADATLDGRSLSRLAMDALDELLTVGRAALVVDYSDEAKRPFVRLYTAEQVINWHATVEGGHRVLRWVVLEEAHEQAKADDIFERERLKQYRVYRLEGQGEAARVFVDVYREAPQSSTGGATSWKEQPLTSVELRRRGEPLRFIPIVCLPDWPITKPPLLDLADVNLSHYRTSADLEHGLHYTALPTPWAVGVPENTKLAIGSGVAWILNDSPNSKAEMLEFRGQGLEAVRTAAEDKKKQMAVLGARLLEEQPTTQETAHAVGMRHQGEMSVLKRLALDIASGLDAVLTWMAWWAHQVPTPDVVQDVISVEVNTAFLPASVEPNYLTAMVAALEKGAISHDVFWHALSRADAVPDGWTKDDEVKAIEAAAALRQERETAAARALLREQDEHEDDEDEDEDEDDASGGGQAS